MPNDAAALSALSKIFLLGFDDLDRSVEVFDKTVTLGNRIEERR